VPVLARMSGIVKRFDDVVANDGVTVEFSAGEIHVLLGENGAGKTTLMNVLYGLSRPDEGNIELGGRPAEIHGPLHAMRLGVGMVHQHPLLVGRLTVAENLRLGGVGDGTADGLRAAVAEVTRVIPLDIDPARRVEDLPLSQRQRLELVRCLARGVRLLILDEPTAVLTPAEVERLFTELRSLTTQGRGVVLITHKLSEVAEVAQRVTVLRGGRSLGTTLAGERSLAELSDLMVGRQVPAVSHRGAGAVGTAPRLRLRGARVGDENGRCELDDVTLEVHPGEIVCVVGVEGNGQRALADVCFGRRPVAAGSVELDGAILPPVGEWRRRGVRLGRVPEDRRHEGLVLDAPLWRNLLLGPMAPPSRFLLHRRRALRRARRLLTEYEVRPADPHALAAALSGGNQQKVVLARELSGEPGAVVAVNPTRGLDVGAQHDVHLRLARLRDDGVALLVISTDLDETLALADRIAVLYRGRLAGPYPADEAGRDLLGRLMAGLGPGESEPPGAGVSAVAA